METPNFTLYPPVEAGETTMEKLPPLWVGGGLTSTT